MSVKIMSTVWEESSQRGSALLVLLALANAANDFGFCWPGFEHLGKKARITGRQAQAAIKKLESAGEIYCHRGGGRHHSNEYIICVGLTDAEIARRLTAFFDIGQAQAEQTARSLITRRNMEKISMKSEVEKHGKEREKLGVEKMLKTSTDPSLETSLETSGETPTPPIPGPSAGQAGADAPAAKVPPSMPLTCSQNHALRQFLAKRLNPAQKEALLALEKQYGSARVNEALDWAAREGMTLGHAINAIKSALPHWGQARAGANGNGGHAPSGALHPGGDAARAAANQAELEKFKRMLEADGHANH